MNQFKKLRKTWTIKRSAILPIQLTTKTQQTRSMLMKKQKQSIHSLFFFTKYAPRSLFIETFIKEKATCWYHTDHNSDNEVLHYNSIVLIFLINHDWTTMQHKTENFTQTKNIHFNKQWKTLFLFFMKIGNLIFFFKKKMNITCSIHRYWKKHETISNTKIQSWNK